MSSIENPDFAEFFARGYAFGFYDASKGETDGTMRGISFGMAYAQHVRQGNGSRQSIQGAFTEWNATGKISGVELPIAA